jgi:predicted RNase H-like nuclease (RuvC/YqgF family)
MFNNALAILAVTPKDEDVPQVIVDYYPELRELFEELNDHRSTFAELDAENRELYAENRELDAENRELRASAATYYELIEAVQAIVKNA